jgi:hypothetical protein
MNRTTTVTRPSRNFRQLYRGILQELVGGILLESQIPVMDNAPGEVNPTKWQGEYGSENRQGFCSSQFAYAASTQQCANPEVFQKGRNPVMQSFSLLLLLARLNMVQLSFFFLISLGISQIQCIRKQKAFHV